MSSTTFYSILRVLSSDTDELRIVSPTETTKHFIDTAWQNNEYSTVVAKTMSRALVKMLIHIIISSNEKNVIKNKFSYFKSTIDNTFINKNTKDEFLDIFSKAQSLYKKMNRLVFMYKWKKAPIRMATDLFMNPISETQKNVVTIMHCNGKFLFTPLDLKNVFENALSNSPYFFAEPISPKNPFNNLPFDKANLYNIYFKLKHGENVMSSLFHQYFLSNFNLNVFRNINAVLIRKIYIEKYLKNACIKNLHKDCLVMLSSNRYCKRLNIDESFPEARLVEIMRPYLEMYYIYNYSLDMYARSISMNQLDYALRKFAAYNPGFGRKIYIKQSNNKFTPTYNDKHIVFAKYVYHRSKYETSHLNVLDDDEDEDEDEDEDDLDESLDVEEDKEQDEEGEESEEEREPSPFVPTFQNMRILE